MENNRRDLVHVVKSFETEGQMQTFLFELNLEMAKVPNVISTWVRGSKIHCLLLVERKFIEVQVAAPSKKVTKKVAKKKTKKKASGK